MLTAVHPRIAGVLSQVAVSCNYASSTHLGCQSMVPLADLRRHVHDECPFRPSALRHSPLRRVVTHRTPVSDVLAASPSKLKGDVSRRLIYHLVSAQEKRRKAGVDDKGQAPNVGAAVNSRSAKQSRL